MASPTFLVQQVLSALTNREDDPTTAHACTSNSTNVLSKPGSSSLKGALDLPSLLFMFLSSSALRDWLKLIVIGGVFEYCRRLAFYCYGKLYSRFFITAYFEEGDTTYHWIMIWLSKQPSWNQTREVQISTRTFGLDEDEDGDGDNQKLTFLPALSSTFSLWHKGRWMRVTRTRADTQSIYAANPRETLELRILSWNYGILTEILQEAKTLYKASKENVVSVFVATSQNEWRFVASRPKRNIDSIVLDPGIKELLIDDAKDFMDSKAWYSARGIPFRRGYLLYGAPGSGKTSVIHSIAGELNLDVYILSLSRAGLDDTSLSELISDLPEKCIALMEDIDAAFSQILNRDAIPESPATPDSGKPNDPGATGVPTSRISLSGLLNALDGVAAQEGRLLFATTNKYSALDSALTRPGRMDLHIEFRLASKFQAAQLYRCFYLPDAQSEAKAELSVSDSTNSSSEKGTSTSSSGSSTPLSFDATTLTCKGVSHRLRAPKLTQQEIDDLSAQFSEALPEREFSMASLQGYLMMYKVRPYDAVKDFPDWIEREQRGRAAKAS